MIDTSANVIISKANEVFLRVNAEPHIEYELRDHFTFQVEGAKFMPQYRNRNWNGEIHLFDLRSKRIYVGLLDRIVAFCKKHDYSYKFVENEYYGVPYEENEGISYQGVKDYMASICSHSPRKYQIEGVYDALKHNRKLLISPTASGKSLMIYSLVRYYIDKGQKILLIVPTTSLVEQMYKDFQDYGWDSESYCHRIYSGKEKTNEFPVTITTWQSVYKNICGDSMTQNPNHNPENPYTSALREMSLEQLGEFFALYQRNILRENRSSMICLKQWAISIAFYYALRHRILPLLDTYVGDGD